MATATLLFLITSAVATAALLGVAYRNGLLSTISHECAASHDSIFGTEPFDELICNIVSFFIPILDNANTRLSSLMNAFNASLIPIFTVLIVEGLRHGNQKGWLNLNATTLYQLAIIFLGSAIATPLIQAAHHRRGTTFTSRSPDAWTINASAAGAALPAIFISFLLPAFFITQAQITKEQTIYVLLFMLFPIYTNIATRVFAFINKILFGDRPTYVTKHQGNYLFGSGPLPTLRRLYLTTFLFALGGHLLNLIQILQKYGLQEMKDIFIPAEGYRFGEAIPNTHVGVQVFLQYDFLITGLSCILFAALAVQNQTTPSKTLILFIVLAILSIPLGYGAVILACWALREERFYAASLKKKK